MDKQTPAKQLAENALTELAAQLQAGHSDRLKAFLDCLGRFHRYSWTNCMLIAQQNPDATHVAGFWKWLELKRHVRKGEKGIAILAPLKYRKQLDDSDGKEKTETGVYGFRVVHVFDISQTEGEELPEFPRITGEPGELLVGLETLIRDSGIELRYGAVPLGAKGVSLKGTIIVAEGLEPAERVAILAHELAHETLHDEVRRKECSKTVKETEAEAVAYAVCRAFGLDCSTRSSDYIQLYDGDTEVLSQSLALIQQTVVRIIDGLTETSSRRTHQDTAAPQLAC